MIRPSPFRSSRAPRGIFLSCPDENENNPSDDAAIHGDSTVPDAPNLVQVVGVVAPFKDDVIDSAADDAQRNKPQHFLIDVIRYEAEALCVMGTVEHAHKEGRGQNHAVPVYAVAEHGEISFGVKGEISSMGKEMDASRIMVCVMESHFLRQDYRQCETVGAKVMPDKINALLRRDALQHFEGVHRAIAAEDAVRQGHAETFKIFKPSEPCSVGGPDGPIKCFSA